MRALLALALLASAAAVQAQTKVDQGALRPGEPREVDIAAGEDHAWSVPVQPSHVHEVRVDQLGVNVDVRWKAGAESRRVNKRRGRSGAEIVWWVGADDAAAATVTVRPATQRGGRYRITLLPPRPAEAADLERHAAEKLLFGAPKPDALEEAARRFEALGLPDRHVLALNRLTDAADDQGDHARGVTAGERCVAAARAAGFLGELADCLVALADALDNEDAGRAGDVYAEAVRIREGLGDPGPIAADLNDWSNVLTAQGAYDRADAMLGRALALALEEEDAVAAAIIQGSRGALAGYRGDLEAAVAAFETAREALRAHGRPDQKAVTALNAGIAYGQIGDFERSLARLREAVGSIAEQNALKPLVAYGRLAIGAEHDDRGDYDSAVPEIEAAIALAVEGGDGDFTADGQALLGWVLSRQGHLERAIEQAAAARVSADRTRNPLKVATAALYQGMVLTNARRYREAEPPLRQALEWFIATGRVDDQARTLAALARAARGQGDLTSALGHVERGLAGFESVRVQVALADQRAHYHSFRREAYDEAVAILLESERRAPGRGHRSRAFEVTERARARSFLEEMGRAHAQASSALPPELARSHRSALDRISHLQRDLVARHTSAAPDHAAIARLERELQEAVVREETARRALRDAAPGIVAAPPAAVTSEAVAARLAADEAVLEYHVGRDRSWLFVVTRPGLAVFELAGEKELRREVDVLRQQLSRPSLLGAHAYGQAASGLYARLVHPAAARLRGVRRLHVVPDGPLWELPFEALVTARTAVSTWTALPYALLKWQIVYHSSASAVAGSPPARSVVPSPTGPTLVAFANPRFTGDAPAPVMARVERAVFRENDRWSLPALPCAEREARQAAALFGSANARVFAGDQARESRVKSDPDVAGARYLLFSTHALLSETMPSQSSLVLNLREDGAEDGLLQTHEIDALRLDADVVMLSACESALGRNLRGEGLLGLARGFFHAGARAVVASLWKVADCSTADLTTTFFSGLAGPRAADPVSALRSAKLALLKKPATAHPYYWAPFVLVSAGR